MGLPFLEKLNFMRLFVTLSIILFASFFIIKPCYSQQIIDRIVAKVNESIITRSDLDKRLEQDNNYNNIYSSWEKKEYKKLVLEKMVIEKLLLKKADELGISINEKALNLQLMELYNADSLDELKTIMKELNIDIDEARKWITALLKIEKLLKMEVYSKNQITQKELMDYSEKKQENIEVHARQILIKIPDNCNNEKLLELQEKTSMIREKLLNGGDFVEISNQYSDAQNKEGGGDFGYIRKGGLPEHFEKILFSLKKDEISDVLQTNIGLHILQVVGIRQIQEDPDKLREEMTRARESEFQKEYIEALKAESIIKILL